MVLQGTVRGIFRAQGDEQATQGTSTGPRMSRAPVGNARVAVLPLGLADSVEYHRRPTSAVLDGSERALLAQCTEHFRELSAAFPGVASLVAAAARSDTAGLGENLRIQGLTCDTVCVGDVFSCRDKHGAKLPLRLQVTGPRRPCHHVDEKHGQRFGGKGVRQMAAENGLAGWFFRVLCPGDLGIGDVLVLEQRPRPAWTMRRVSSLFWRGVGADYKITQWRGTAWELVQLASMGELAEEEWREALRPLMSPAVVATWALQTLAPFVGVVLPLLLARRT